MLETLAQSRVAKKEPVHAIERLTSKQARRFGVKSAVKRALETIGWPRAMGTLQRVSALRQAKKEYRQLWPDLVLMDIPFSNHVMRSKHTHATYKHGKI